MKTPADPRLIPRDGARNGGIALMALAGASLRGDPGRACRTGGLDGDAGARRILAALAGPRTGVGLSREED